MCANPRSRVILKCQMNHISISINRREILRSSKFEVKNILIENAIQKIRVGEVKKFNCTELIEKLIALSHW